MPRVTNVELAHLYPLCDLHVYIGIFHGFKMLAYIGLLVMWTLSDHMKNDPDAEGWKYIIISDENANESDSTKYMYIDAYTIAFSIAIDILVMLSHISRNDLHLSAGKGSAELILAKEGKYRAFEYAFTAGICLYTTKQVGGPEPDAKNTVLELFLINLGVQVVGFITDPNQWWFRKHLFADYRNPVAWLLVVGAFVGVAFLIQAGYDASTSYWVGPKAVKDNTKESIWGIISFLYMTFGVLHCVSVKYAHKFHNLKSDDTSKAANSMAGDCIYQQVTIAKWFAVLGSGTKLYIFALFSFGVWDHSDFLYQGIVIIGILTYAFIVTLMAHPYWIKPNHFKMCQWLGNTLCNFTEEDYRDKEYRGETVRDGALASVQLLKLHPQTMQYVANELVE